SLPRAHQHRDASVLAASASSQFVVLMACAEQLDGTVQLLARFSEAPHEHENHALAAYFLDPRRPIVTGLRSSGQPGRSFEGPRQLPSYDTHGCEPEQNMEV